MKNLSFLDGFELAPVEAPSKGKGGSSGPRLQRRPNEGADLRVFKNGRVYPSEAFEATFELAFGNRVEEIDPVGGNVITTIPGNGLDFIDSAKWQMTKALAERLLFVGITPRQGNGKIDVMGSCSYDENGVPKKTIMDAGAYTAAKEHLIPAIAEVYGVNWEDTPHVDIKVVTDYPMVSPTGFYILPKVVARGEDKGKPSFARRENINIFPMVLVEAPKEEEVEQIIPNNDLLEAREPAGEVPEEVAEHPVSKEDAIAPGDQAANQASADAAQDTAQAESVESMEAPEESETPGNILDTLV